jgi:hypothetical protein
MHQREVNPVKLTIVYIDKARLYLTKFSNSPHQESYIWHLCTPQIRIQNIAE